MRLLIDPALLRAQIPELAIRPGMTLAARVAERHGSRGLITIAGAPLAAELPEHVRAGDTLRLHVTETSADRVVMRLMDEGPAPPQPTAVPVPLPGGRQAHLLVDEREADGRRAGERAAVTISYRSPRLGAIDFRLGLEGGALTAHVKATAGAPHELALEQAEALREALARATGKPVQLSVSPRHDPLDVYA
jgi:hypothetical protein